MEPTRTPTIADPTRVGSSGRRLLHRGLVWTVIETLVLTAVLFWFVQSFIAQPFRVEGGSMEPTLTEGNYLVVDRITPRFAPYARGDVVVFVAPTSAAPRAKDFIKRLIGLPGDVVELRDGLVYVNGSRLDEGYVYDGQPTEPSPASPSQTRWVVPPDAIFLLGDHRAASDDSRTFGVVPLGSVIGRAFIRYGPIELIGILGRPVYPGLR